MENSRRDFLKKVGMAGGALATVPNSMMSRVTVAASSAAGPETQAPVEHDVIKIRNPKKLGVDHLVAERIRVGAKGEYKPCIAKVHGNELILVNYLGNVQPLPTYLYRSFDGGRTWSDPDKTAIPPGEEPYLSRLKEGTLLLNGGGNRWGTRSGDGGRTWVRDLRPSEYAAKVAGILSRNILQLWDGSLLEIVDVPGKGKPYQYGNEYVARSMDDGQTWPEIYPLRIEGVPPGYPWPIFSEAHLWQARSGKLYAIARVDHRYFRIPGRKLSDLELASVACSLFQYGYPLVKDISEAEIDHLNHLKVFSSTDLGRTWQPGPDLGDYGTMFHSILRLQDGRLLLTYTRRSIDPPLGVRAVLGKETEDGFEFDFEHDIIMIDTKTPIGRGSGGGFGPTVQLDDGTGKVLVDARGAEYDLIRFARRETGSSFSLSLRRVFSNEKNSLPLTSWSVTESDLISYAESVISSVDSSMDSGEIVKKLFTGGISLGGSSSRRYRLSEHLILPDHWYDVTGTCSENPLGQDESSRHVIKKGENEPTFLISWRSEKEIEGTLRNRAALHIFGGGVLTVICLAILLWKFGWL